MISYRIDIECALNGGATGRHWSDRSRRRAGVDRFQLALGPGTGAQGHRDAGSDFRRERYQCIMCIGGTDIPVCASRGTDRNVCATDALVAQISVI
jgi:hypothetical protein